MAGGNLSPRQKMINMMYLVLIALMAMNVSAEILAAFRAVNSGLNEAITALDNKHQKTMQQFSKQLDNDESKTKPYYDKAIQINNITDSLKMYIADLKAEIVEKSDGWEIQDNGDSIIAKEKDLDVPSEIMINRQKGFELQQEIFKARERIFKVINDKELNLFLDSSLVVFNAEDPENDRQGRDFARYRFEMVPSVAAITLLTQMQMDIKTSQTDIVERLLGSIGADDISFDVLEPVVKMPRTSIVRNEEFEATILLAAYSSTQNPNITIGDQELEVEAGKANFSMKATSVGTQKKEGVIEVLNPVTGESNKYPFNFEFDVFEAPATISADAMNVLYIGLDNPISVSVPGYKPDQLNVTCKGCQLKKQSSGSYIATVARGREATISVSVDGRTAGSKEFRVKQVPKPIAYFGQYAEGEVSKAEMNLVNFISARMDGFVFENVKYKISKFRFLHSPKTGSTYQENGRGPQITPGMKNAMSKSSRGDVIIFTDVYVTGPGGERRLDKGITLTVK